MYTAAEALSSDCTRDIRRDTVNSPRKRGLALVANDATRAFIQNEGSVTTIDVRETADEIADLIGEAERCAGVMHSALPAIRRDLP